MALRAGKLRIGITERYPLGAAEQAHADIASRRTSGKLLLDRASEPATNTEQLARRHDDPPAAGDIPPDGTNRSRLRRGLQG